jgi:hypothetical protein
VALLVLMATCLAARSAPMTFRLAGNGGNCAGCQWIAADGEITSKTPDVFRKELDGLRGDLGEILIVHLNSQGGDLFAGVELGKLFRANHLVVSVSRTVKSKTSPFDDSEEGVCLSACSYAFIGGETRYAEPREIGIHQFSSSLSNSGRRIVKIRKERGREIRVILSTTQSATAYLFDYVTSMGVDPRFLALASSAQNIYYLTKSELDLYRVRWQPTDFMPWSIRVSGRGIQAFSQSRDHSLTATVFCRADGIPRFQITGQADQATLNKDREVISGIEVLGIPVDLDAMEIKAIDGKPTIEIKMKKFDPKSLPPDVYALSIDAHPVFGRHFFYTLSREGAGVNISAALQNCI